MTCIDIVLRFWLGLAPWYLDVGESPEQRAELYRPAADAVCTVGRTPLERAYLAAQTYAETRLARYVLEDRCEDGPVGARCDGGLATGPWQVRAWCREAWTGSEPSRLKAGAACSLRMFRWGYRRCETDRLEERLAAGFAANGGGSTRCGAPWAGKRVSMLQTVWARLTRREATR